MRINGRPLIYGTSFCLVIVCWLLVLSSCTMPATPSQPPPSQTPTQPPPTPSEPEHWFKPELYTGIPSPSCKPPVTDVANLPAASVKLNVDTAKSVGTIDHNIWAGYIGNNYPSSTSEQLLLTWELMRSTGVFRYARADDMYSDGLNTRIIPTVKQILKDGKPSGDISPSQLAGYYAGCNIYEEDTQGKTTYNFWFLDAMLDMYVSHGLKPIVQMEYMPDDLVDENDKVRLSFGGLINTPKDYNKWRELVYRTAKHCIERYGLEEVRTWYFTVREEPDLNTFFIDGGEPAKEGIYYNFSQCPNREVAPPSGSLDRYFKMYDYFADGIKSADSQLRVGGPNIAFHDWFRPFLTHCTSGTNFATNGSGAPLDAIFWHSYGNIDFHLKNARKKLDIIKQFPSLKGIPTIIDEWGQVLLKGNANDVIPYEYGETLYTNYDAVYVSRFIDGILTDPTKNPSRITRWGGLTISPRYLTISRMNSVIPMPILNTFLILAKMGEEQVALTGSNCGDLVHGFASRTEDGVQVLLYHFNEQDEQGTSNPIEIDLTVEGLLKEWSTMKRYQIDNKTSNAWIHHPVNTSFKTDEELARAEADAKLKIIEQTDKLDVRDGKITFRLVLPVNSVSLIAIGEEALPPKRAVTPHIDRLTKEKDAYMSARNKLWSGNIAGAKTDFQQLAQGSFQLDGKPLTNPYSIWGKKALYALFDIARKEQDFGTTNRIRVRLLATTTLNDVERYCLLNEQLRFLEATGKKDEIPSTSNEIGTVKKKIEYFANWSKWIMYLGESEYEQRKEDQR